MHDGENGLMATYHEKINNCRAIQLFDEITKTMSEMFHCTAAESLKRRFMREMREKADVYLEDLEE